MGLLPPFLDWLFWLMVILAVGWLAVCVSRSVSTRPAPFWKGLQAVLFWSVAAVAFVWAAVVLGVALELVYLVNGLITP